MPGAELSAVLFDMDGTLMDSEKLWAVGLRELCERLGGELTDELRVRLVGMDQRESMEVVHTEFGLPFSEIDASTDWLIARMKQLFAGGVVWRPGAQRLLSEVRASGMATALVTATGRELVDVIIETVGAHHFDVTVVGDEVTHNKPDPEPYQTAVKALRVNPSDTLAIEDSPTGVASAHAAGCPVLAVPSEARIPERPGVTILETLREVNLAGLRRIHAGGLSDGGAFGDGRPAFSGDGALAPAGAAPGLEDRQHHVEGVDARRHERRRHQARTVDRREPAGRGVRHDGGGFAQPGHQGQIRHQDGPEGEEELDQYPPVPEQAPLGSDGQQHAGYEGGQADRQYHHVAHDL
ncbi:MAG: HAD family hydrolase [Stackebrandtia sp.]